MAELFIGDDMGYHEGYHGAFSRGQAPGAMLNGTRIKKVWSEPGDSHKNGATGTILGSANHPDLGFAYFVEWDDAPRVAVGTIAMKIGPA